MKTMAYFTKTEVRKAAKDAINESTLSKAESVLDSARRVTASVNEFDVFLSHSSKDAELVLGVKKILEMKGLKVYVDWDTDSQLDRRQVDAETAELIRKRMRQSKSLIYIATSNSTNSKWMPWELGFFDGFSSGGVAILPIVDYSYESFSGQEYLGIYPLVDQGEYENTRKSDVFVNKKGGWMTVASFGKGSKSWSKYS